MTTDPVVVSESEVPPQGATSPDATASHDKSPPPGTRRKSKVAGTRSVSGNLYHEQRRLKTNNLDKFAAIDIIPDKTMRIILTGDLFFALGESQLSENAKASLRQIVTVIQQSPYMINVVGHTDNLPMRSNQFKSNWELSVARASSVARFLIDEMGMNPVQFVVSGYASYRPIAPNTTAENRAKKPPGGNHHFKKAAKPITGYCRKSSVAPLSFMKNKNLLGLILSGTLLYCRLCYSWQYQPLF